MIQNTLISRRDQKELQFWMTLNSIFYKGISKAKKTKKTSKKIIESFQYF